MRNKIIFLIILLALALILFVSCSSDKNGGDTPANTNNNNPAPGEIILEDLYFFRLGAAGNQGESTLFKINPVTRTASFVCIDPLCSHAAGSDCPLESIGVNRNESIVYHITGNYLFFLRGGIVHEAGYRFGSIELLVYDMLNGVIRKLAEYTDGTMNREWSVFGSGRYLFYPIVYFNDTDTGRIDRFVYYRADAVTGEIIELPLPTEIRFTMIDKTYELFLQGEDSSNDLMDYPWIAGTAGDKIHWMVRFWPNPGRGVAQGQAYTTDLDGNNIESIPNMTGLMPYSVYHDGYSYGLTSHLTLAEEMALEPGSYEHQFALMDRTLYRTLLGSHVEDEEHNRLLSENVISFRLLGDKIYLTILEEEPELIEYGGFQTWNWSGGKIWVMSLDGTDKRLLADTGYNLTNAFFEVKTINGIDYIAVSFNIITEDPFVPSEYWRIPSPDTIIINASTGEWVVLPPPE
jgi:hypothetical protein